MIGDIFKKIFGIKNNQGEISDGEQASKTSGLGKKITKLTEFYDEKTELVKNEFFSIKNKCKNLRETNYALGLKHLQNGNLSEAIFRFRFIKKFWPDLFDAHYQLAYCLALKNKSAEAKKILEELLRKKPDYDQKAKELLERINKGITNA